MENRRKQIYKHSKIWQIAIQITDDIFEIIAAFPREQNYDLRSQINRCAITLPNHITGGSTRTNKSFSHFIDISLGASFDLVTELIIANNRNYLSDKKLE